MGAKGGPDCSSAQPTNRTVLHLHPQVGYRPWPQDGYPAVGSCAAAGCPNLYSAVMHSGMTLGPYLGRLLADEVVSGREVHEAVLGPYRPCRGYGSPADSQAYGWAQTPLKPVSGK